MQSKAKQSKTQKQLNKKRKRERRKKVRVSQNLHVRVSLCVPLYQCLSACVRVCKAQQSKRTKRDEEEAPPNCFRLSQCLRPQRRSRRRSSSSSSRSDNNNRGRKPQQQQQRKRRSTEERERGREIGESKANSKDSPRMQPTLPQAAGTADMDLTAVQSINDWFFKKEQIYLLAQFWQQVSDGPLYPIPIH